MDKVQKRSVFVFVYVYICFVLCFSLYIFLSFCLYACTYIFCLLVHTLPSFLLRTANFKFTFPSLFNANSSCPPSCISRSLSSCLWFFVYSFISFCSLSSLFPFFSHSFVMFSLLIFLFPFVKTFSSLFSLACLSSPLLPFRLRYFYSNLLMFCAHMLLMSHIIFTLFIATLRLRYSVS
jgi:hypothetical protein